MSHATPLIAGLLRPEAYPHPVERIELLETHISWVLLTGQYAYKIKKPVDLGFLDFSSLEKRRHYCEEELRLNRRLAPALYLAVVSIADSMAGPRLSGDGRPLEYAVKMRQFPAGARFDELLARDALAPRHLDLLADAVAEFHARAPCAAPATRFGLAETIRHPVEENFAHLDTLLSADDATRLARLAAWSRDRWERLVPLFDARKRDGFIKECHGDLHLANIALVDGRPLVFDCIEFSESLRWIDVMSEVAFLVMDLHDRGHRDLAFRFLNRYLETSGDYAGLALLPYYLAYRAMVRAKVAAIQADQEQGAGRAALLAKVREYLSLADDLTRAPTRTLVVTHGLAGSGKTTVTQGLLEALGAIRMRSDVERKRLYGYQPLQATGAAGIEQGMYGRAAGERTYGRLRELAAAVLEAGYPAIVDATFLRRSQRRPFSALARQAGVPCVILALQAPQALLRARIAQRLEAAADASEADQDVLRHQLGTLEPVGPDEGHVVTIDAAFPPEPPALAAAITAASRERS